MKRHILYFAAVCFIASFSLSSCNKDKTPEGQVVENAVQDKDGNKYSAVKIGEHTWMAENLRTTKYADGTPIPMGTTTDGTTGYRYNPNGDANNVKTHGYLYNWTAAMNGKGSSDANPSGVQGVCPKGWHMPSKTEWEELINYIGRQSEFVCTVNEGDAYVAKAMASTEGWEPSAQTCAPGNLPSTNNATGLNGTPAGAFSGSYSAFKISANMWSTSEDGSDKAWVVTLNYMHPNNSINSVSKGNAYSVRCVKD